MMWTIRWHITGALVNLAFWIAPRSVSRDVYMDALNSTSRKIMAEINAQKARLA